MNFRLPGLLLSFALAAPLLLAEPKEVEVNVNVDLTPAGRKLTLPTREHPAYYFPVVGGYREEGAVTAGDKAPPRRMVVRQLAKTLAEHGYLVAGAKTPAPTVLLVFHWGCMNPEIEEFGDVSGDPEESRKLFLNQKKMLALVAGQSLANLDLDFEREAVMQGAEEDRYFVVISAFDFAAAQQRKKVLLWRTKMSTTADTGDIGDVLATLIKSGGPWLGRETVRPVWTKQPFEPRGTVKLGDLKVQEYLEPGRTPDKKPGGAAKKP
jgi:hypothetical protein